MPELWAKAATYIDNKKILQLKSEKINHLRQGLDCVSVECWRHGAPQCAHVSHLLGLWDHEQRAWFSNPKFFMSCNFHQPCGTNGQRWAASRQKHSPTPSPPSSWCLDHISDLRIILTSLSNSRAEEDTWHSGKAKAASGRGKSGGIGRSEVSTDSSSTSGFTWMKKITNYFRLTWSVLTSWATYKSFFIISRACVRSFSQTFEA